MPRKPRKLIKTRPMLTEQVRHFLEFGEFQKGSQNVLVFKLAGKRHGDEGQLREIWADHRDEILKDWIKDNPGSRPWAWWVCDAKEARMQVGGSGIPYIDDLEMGIPRRWLGARPDAPPVVESQAAYLQRLHLLTSAEKTFIRDNPEFLAPISLGEE
jgi:hypothetical protein